MYKNFSHRLPRERYNNFFNNSSYTKPIKHVGAFTLGEFFIFFLHQAYKACERGTFVTHLLYTVKIILEINHGIIKRFA